MEGFTSFQPVAVIVHLSFFILGCISIEIFLAIRERNASTMQRADSALQDALESARNRFINRSSLISMKRLGTLVFGLGCMSSFGFIFDTCLLNFVDSEADRKFVTFIWDCDVILAASLLYIIVPSGLFHKYIKLKPEYKFRQRFLRFFLFVGSWIVFGLILGKVMLLEAFSRSKNETKSFALLSILYTFCFGLAFISILMGFSAVYLIYIVYAIHRDASYIKQLEDLISDSKKVLRDLKMFVKDANFSDDESCSEEVLMDEMYRTTDYYDRAVQLRMNNTQRKYGRTSSILSKFPRLSRIINKVTGSQDGDQYGDYKNMINDIKNEIRYLRILKMEKESTSNKKGRLYLYLRYLEATVSVINCCISSRRALIVLFGSVTISSEVQNADVLASTYYYFMGKDVAAEILHVDSPTPVLDAVISGVNLIFIVNIIASSFGYFLDFGKILLNTKYLQKRKLLSDNSLGLALTSFCILSFPSQFCLLIPFLPHHFKKFLLELFFGGSARVWAGLRYCFDTLVFFSSVFTFFGVLFLRYSRKIKNNVYCNV
ncbi:hypothetical protein BEWA_007970 [Theileria equi strain WA]|uniref:Uncharacterized protein n=1 Tax=Theileria equi strain WA TaxID=1537102 RepID=L0B1P1_THEEQ|nr:hypothetical protein BEWA_007970 [Theileria equi strain WA]AFZ81388.1 hypothetical protein BEWA_007970 [Theileria equi strain WA]|eukprot:XP_004831054.1 hypothetical protein BEWA_007970 [Theileria equi strain WA]